MFNNIERVERNRKKELAIPRQGERKESVLKRIIFYNFYSLRVRISRSIPVARRRKVENNLRIANHPKEWLVFVTSRRDIIGYKLVR